MTVVSWRRCSTKPTPARTCSATAPIGRPRPRRSLPRTRLSQPHLRARYARPSAVEGQGGGEPGEEPHSRPHRTCVRCAGDRARRPHRCARSGSCGRASRSVYKTLSTTFADWQRSNGWPPPNGRTPSAADPIKKNGPCSSGAHRGTRNRNRSRCPQGCSLRRAALIRGLMTDDEWAYFEPFLLHRGGRPPRNHRRVLDAVFWVMRTGAP